ncbi:MAG: sodium:solute symporter family protein [Verrucomicrobia bacterium]|nr:sodium:solute symporter family protein [Verrucomicrobiota bacterium]
MHPINELIWIDYIIIAIYFAFVIGIGFVLRQRVKTSEDFLLSGRSIPAWIAGLAFLSANLGAQEVIGMAASGAKYGISTSHFYWLGAIPAMVFVGIFMMPFYYGSRAKSVPDYLSLRYDEKTRAFNALTFAAMTMMSSGISMYAMALLLQTIHIFDAPFRALGLPSSWVFHVSIVASALIVLAYIYLGGLTSAIYNEVMQFFLIVAGFFPLVFLGLVNVGGWKGLTEKLPADYTHAWYGMHTGHNLLGVEWFGLVMGLGFVLSFGYWCTDFLVIQRAMAADSMGSARRVPLIASVPKMFFPFLVILPGLIALALTKPVMQQPTLSERPDHAPQSAQIQSVQEGMIPAQTNPVTGKVVRDKNGEVVLDYNMVIPNMLLHYFPSGMLGLGLTALLASFMSGMAGNVTAFNTVWTYDIFKAYIRRDATDQNLLMVGQLATFFGVVFSIGVAYFVAAFNNIMDVLQLVFAFVNAPLFATFLLGMFWKRATGHGAFFGLLCGTLAAALHHGLTISEGAHPGVQGAWIATVHTYPSQMAQNFYTAIFAWTVCFVATIVISLLTRPRPEEELRGLVYALTEKSHETGGRWYARPVPMGLGVLLLTLILNLVFR